jgi:hypothetical protein
MQFRVLASLYLRRATTPTIDNLSPLFSFVSLIRLLDLLPNLREMAVSLPVSSAFLELSRFFENFLKKTLVLVNPKNKKLFQREIHFSLGRVVSTRRHAC